MNERDKRPCRDCGKPCNGRQCRACFVKKEGSSNARRRADAKRRDRQRKLMIYQREAQK